MSKLIIRQSSPADDTPEQVAFLKSFINGVYKTEEVGMWKAENSGRVTPDEVSEYLQNSQLFFAILNGDIVGSVKIEMIDDTTLEFGMLVANPDYRGIGIGRDLVAAVERHARKQGYTTMRLELLTPQDWVNPSKEFLKSWYSRIGYVPGKTIPFTQEFPRRKNEFACPCDFTIWLKELN